MPRRLTPSFLNNQPCTLVLFIALAGELESLLTIEGNLACAADQPTLLHPLEGGDPIQIPPHLADCIESTKPEHRELLEDLVTPFLIRAFYEDHLDDDDETIDLNAILPRCAGELPAD